MKVGTDGVLLGSWVSYKNPTEILDIGTGTGLIIKMLHKEILKLILLQLKLIKQQVKKHNLILTILPEGNGFVL